MYRVSNWSAVKYLAYITDTFLWYLGSAALTSRKVQSAILEKTAPDLQKATSRLVYVTQCTSTRLSREL